MNPGKFHDRPRRCRSWRPFVSIGLTARLTSHAGNEAGEPFSRSRSFEPPRLSCTAQRIKNPGPAVPPRISRVHLPGSGATIFTIRAFPPDGKLSDNPDGTQEPVRLPGRRLRGKAARCHARRRPRVWSRPPGRAACRGRPGPASTRSVGGIASSDASLVKDREQRAQTEIIAKEPLLDLVKNPLLPSRPAHAGLPVPCADGTAGHATGIPRFPARASCMAFEPVPERPAKRA